MRIPRQSLTLCAGLALFVSACGGGDSDDRPAAEQGAARDARAQLNGADNPRAGEFPQPGGRSLQQLASEFEQSQSQAGLATSVFTPGRNRLAFGVIGPDQKFVYGPSAVYVAKDPSDPAVGPFPAPADPLVTDPAYRSRQAAGEGDPFAAVYAATVPFEEPGTYSVLIATRTGGRMIATPTQVKVTKKSPVPEVGDKAPVVDTDTLESVGGDVKQLDTRLPPSDMHDTNFRDVVGEKPVALLFATPQLCQSRVCGPVVDIAAQLKERYGDRIEFIHQEVYVDNEVEKGLRKPLREYGLPTEPWLFVVGKDGRIKARLEGSFGLSAFEKALQAGLAGS